MWNDTINQGATFYREVTLYSDKNHTKLTPTDGLMPRSALLDAVTGKKVADFPCAWLESSGTIGEPDYLPKRIAWTMPRSVAVTIRKDRAYESFLYMDCVDGTTRPTDLRGAVAVNFGLEP